MGFSLPSDRVLDRWLPARDLTDVCRHTDMLYTTEISTHVHTVSRPNTDHVRQNGAQTRDVRVGPELVQIGPKCDKLRTFYHMT